MNEDETGKSRKMKTRGKKNVSLILKLMLTKLHDKKPQIFEEKN